MDIYIASFSNFLGGKGILKMTRVYVKIWQSTLFGLKCSSQREKKERDI